MRKIILPLIALLSIAALSASALPPPEKDEMTISELAANKFSMEGKIIETEITNASNFEQTAPGKYRAWCYYYKGIGIGSSEMVYIPEEGKEFFKELAEKDTLGGGSTETVYLQVKDGKFTAVGTRFKKSKGIYTW